VAGCRLDQGKNVIFAIGLFIYFILAVSSPLIATLSGFTSRLSNCLSGFKAFYGQTSDELGS
jgi:hypothetical protein